MPEAKLHQEQENALQLMLEGRNVFISGNAGTGKSTVLHAFKLMTKFQTVFIAPTGIAALNIGGTTIHRLFDFPTGVLTPNRLNLQLFPNICETLRSIQTVVVNKVSMVRTDLLNSLEQVLRHTAPFGFQFLPFGGRQIIVSGDFCQLPPVITNGHDYNLLHEIHGGTFAFESAAWQMASFHNVVLQTVHRQAADSRFMRMLGCIRRGGPEEELAACLHYINSRVVHYPPLDGTLNLCTTNRLADSFNQAVDAQLGGEPVCFQAEISGIFDPRAYPTADNLELRIGSRVMLLVNRNDPENDGSFVNGDRGCVVDIQLPDQLVIVKLDDGREITVSPRAWHNCSYTTRRSPINGKVELEQSVIGIFRQMPLRLGYAVTIHKSQGLTLNRVHVQLGDRPAFASGQLYTALSRCRSLEDLSIDRPLYFNDIKLDPRITDFYNGIDQLDFSQNLYQG